MQDTNFKCPKTGEEYSIPNYRIVFYGKKAVYKNKYGKVLVSNEGEVLVPIKRDKGIPTAIFGSEATRMVKHQKFFKKRAKKHANKIDQKINKRDITRKEMSRYMKNQKL